MRSILVIRLSSMGDVILATPIVRQLQRTYPHAIIDVAVDVRFAAVWQGNPRVRTVWPIESRSATDAAMDATKLQMMESVPDGQYDLVVDLQRNVRSRMLRTGLGRSVVLLNKHRMEKLALVWLKRQPRKMMPIVARYRATIDHLPLAFDTEGAEIWLEGEAERGYYPPASAERPHTPRTDTFGIPLPALAHGTRIAVAPGAAHATKRWPVPMVAELCRMFAAEGAIPVLIGGEADVPLCNEVARLCGGIALERADGSASVQRTARVLDTCAAIVTMDSGVMHLASARRIPVVALFGSTVPALGFAPYAVRHTIVEHDVACRPCTHIGRARCPRGHFLCMNGITAEEVFGRTVQLLRRLAVA